MSEAVEGGSALAWRLLATLEGGSLLLATSVLLAYTVTSKIVRENRTRRQIRTVLVTNTTNLLGRELKRRLKEQGCVVETVDQRGCEVTKTGSVGGDKVDAIVVVGAEPKGGLDGMATLVTEDIHNNLRVLENASSRLRTGGYIAWACARNGSATADAFSDASSAFDTVLRTSLTQIAQLRRCEAVWVGRGADEAQAAERTVAALRARARTHAPRTSFSVRNAALRIGESLGRWLKIIA